MPFILTLLTSVRLMLVFSIILQGFQHSPISPPLKPSFMNYSPYMFTLKALCLLPRILYFVFAFHVSIKNVGVKMYSPLCPTALVNLQYLESLSSDTSIHKPCCWPICWSNLRWAMDTHARFCTFHLIMFKCIHNLDVRSYCGGQVIPGLIFRP